MKASSQAHAQAQVEVEVESHKLQLLSLEMQQTARGCRDASQSPIPTSAAAS